MSFIGFNLSTLYVVLGLSYVIVCMTVTVKQFKKSMFFFTPVYYVPAAILSPILMPYVLVSWINNFSE